MYESTNSNEGTAPQGTGPSVHRPVDTGSARRRTLIAATSLVILCDVDADDRETECWRGTLSEYLTANVGNVDAAAVERHLATRGFHFEGGGAECLAVLRLADSVSGEIVSVTPCCGRPVRLFFDGRPRVTRHCTGSGCHKVYDITRSGEGLAWKERTR